jgi:hypothetical protein
VATQNGHHFPLPCTALWRCLRSRVSSAVSNDVHAQLAGQAAHSMASSKSWLNTARLLSYGLTEEGTVYPKWVQHYQTKASFLGHYSEQRRRRDTHVQKLVRVLNSYVIMNSHVRTTLGRVQHTDHRRENPLYNKKNSAEKTFNVIPAAEKSVPTD